MKAWPSVMESQALCRFWVGMNKVTGEPIVRKPQLALELADPGLADAKDLGKLLLIGVGMIFHGLLETLTHLLRLGSPSAGRTLRLR